jgi:hypothetical protein
MTPNEEAYVHYAECINSLNCAWHVLCELRAIDRKTAIHAAAFRFALVEYAKPYTRSDGTFKRYRLPPPSLPVELLALHQQILDLRDQVLAHSDLTLKEAQVYIASHGDHPLVGVASNSLPTFPDSEAVITLIENTLDKMYVEIERHESALGSNA